MRIIGLMLASILVLSACGGSHKSRVSRLAVPVNISATGPISKACISAGRKSASRARCRCVQAVANRTLSNNDQLLAVTFFHDPHRSQEVRQSDRTKDEIFWSKYKAFGAQAKRSCQGT